LSVDEKPVPVPTEQSRPYWQAARERRLVFWHCARCGWLVQEPVMVCSKCRGEQFDWRQVSGRGSIFSFTVARQTTTAGFADDVPYVVVLVSIEEQPELVVTANLVGDDIEFGQIDIGLPVVVDFEDRGDYAIPQFRLV
jgi:uncharacterized protein